MGRGRQAGFTLSEVLVSLGLTSVLLVSALTLARIQLQVHTEQGQIGAAQENVRGALALLVRDARLAGAGVSAGAAVNAASLAPAQVPAVAVRNLNPDELDLLVPGPASAQLLAPAAQADRELLADTAAGGLRGGELVLLSDYRNAVLYPVQDRLPRSVLGISAVGLQVAGAPAFPVPVFPVGSLVLQVQSLRYAVRQGTLVLIEGAPLQPGGTPEPVAEQIHDLEVAVGIDGLGGHPVDGLIQEIGRAAGDDEWVFNVAGESLPAAPFQVRALRITVAGCTALPGSQPGPGRPAIEDRPAGAPDSYRWRVMSETVIVRNMTMR
jgi:prepilin-type N-terminal cleavage/methylation domain-containing protein